MDGTKLLAKGAQRLINAGIARAPIASLDQRFIDSLGTLEKVDFDLGKIIEDEIRTSESPIETLQQRGR